MDRKLSLDDLEGFVWGEPKYSSSLVRRCHELRKVPVGEFSTEDLRILIGQQIGLDYIVELAVEMLERDPFAQGDDYSGDLLCAVLGVDLKFWSTHRDLLRRIDAVLAVVGARLASDEGARDPDAYPLTRHESELLRSAIHDFARDVRAATRDA